MKKFITILVFTALVPSVNAQFTSFVDIDGDGNNDLKLFSDWKKSGCEWRATKKSCVTNLQEVPITFQWAVGGQDNGTVQPGKTVCAEWASWTLIFLATGEVGATMTLGGQVFSKTQRSSGYNCLSDVLKDWKVTLSNTGVTVETSSLPATYNDGFQDILVATADFEDQGGGQYLYTYELQNLSTSPIEVNWRAARNDSNPTGINVTVPASSTLNFNYNANAPPDFYGNFMEILESDGTHINIDAPAWVPTDELDNLIGGNSTNLYRPQFVIEDFESYVDDAALRMVWSSSGTASEPQLEIDNDPGNPDSNVNNEPSSVGLGTGLLNFNGTQSVRLDLQEGTSSFSATGLGLGASDGVVVWAQIISSSTEVSMRINDIPSALSFFVGGPDTAASPQVGGFIGFHFVKEDFPGWDGSSINSIVVEFISPFAQTVYIDEIVSLEPVIVTSVDEKQVPQNMPDDFAMKQNYPNPFNPTTTINYQIPELSIVTLKVFDVLGSEVAILVSEEKPAGSYEVEFSGTALPSGIYFYRIQAGNYIETKKMILMK